MKKFNLYWGGNVLSQKSPHEEGLLNSMRVVNILPKEFVEAVLALEVGESATDEDGDRWERVE